MIKPRILLVIFLAAFVSALWLLMFSYAMIPAHARGPFGSQTAPVE